MKPSAGFDRRNKSEAPWNVLIVFGVSQQIVAMRFKSRGDTWTCSPKHFTVSDSWRFTKPYFLPPSVPFFRTIQYDSKRDYIIGNNKHGSPRVFENYTS